MKTVLIDFDGVLHSYTSGWQGADKVSDPPTPGAMEFIERLLANNYEVGILSSRNDQPGGIDAMKKWLFRHLADAFNLWAAEILLDQIKFPLTKGPHHILIDDRAIPFQGTFPTLHEINHFKPWNKQEL